LALVEIKAEPGLLRELIDVLKRIADGIDRAYPPPPAPEIVQQMKPAGPEALWEFDPEQELEREMEDARRREQGF